MTFNIRDFTKLINIQNNIYSIFIINDVVIYAHDRKMITLFDVLSNDSKTFIKINDVFHVSNFATNLISTIQLICNDERIIFENDVCYLIDKISEKKSFMQLNEKINIF